MNKTTLDSVSENLEISEWAEILHIMIMMSVFILGVPGNGIILFVQLKNRDRSSTDYLVGTMAAFELFCAGFNSLMLVFINIASIWSVIASLALCCVRAYATFLATISSTFLLTALAIDRYVLTCKPFNTFYSGKKAKLICVCILAVSIVCSTPTLALTTFDDKNIKCKQTEKSPALQNVLQLFFGAAYLVMFIVVIFCYSKVTILIRKRQKQRSEVRLAPASTSRISTMSSQHRSTSKDCYFKNKNKIAPENSRKITNTEIATVESQLKSESKTKTGHSGDLKQPGRNIEQIEPITDDEVRKIEMKRVNRTTLIMFLITTIYILSWVVHWLNNSLVPRDTIAGRNVIHLTTNLYMINCVTNPIFFIALSSKFRRNAKMCFKKIFT